MQVRRLWLRDIRVHTEREVEFAEGLTVLFGANGAGKTTILEALHYLATRKSFRGVATEALIRTDAPVGVIRAEVTVGGRFVLLEAELSRGGRDRFLLNRQALRRTAELRDGLRTTVFGPDDLELVKGGPAHRRAWLDEVLGSVSARHDHLVDEVERILRQRAALLRSSGGRLSTEAASTLDVWDARLAEAGTRLAEARLLGLSALEGELVAAVCAIAGRVVGVDVEYLAPWSDAGLAAALAAARAEDVRRAQTTVGPHRDEVQIRVDGRPARTHCSQGEQRTLALALRLAGHRFVYERLGSSPVLLLDDVFSELDQARAGALLAHLPPGQAVLTTASPPPIHRRPEHVVHIVPGQPVDSSVLGARSCTGAPRAVTSLSTDGGEPVDNCG